MRIFTGFLEGERLARAYASADMLLNPSITETFGNINLEAMASGIPIVAAVATGSNCLIDDGINGRLVPAGDMPAFADALARYLTDDRGAKGRRRRRPAPRRRLQLGRHQRRRAEALSRAGSQLTCHRPICNRYAARLYRACRASARLWR